MKKIKRKYTVKDSFAVISTRNTATKIRLKTIKKEFRQYYLNK